MVKMRGVYRVSHQRDPNRVKKLWWEFFKFWLSMQLPIYGGILYLFLFYFDYWTAWLITNTVFAIIMFPINRRYIFKNNDVRKTKNESQDAT